MTEELSATLTMTLRADSGYESTETHRITADQWGRIHVILNEKALADKGSKP